MPNHVTSRVVVTGPQSEIDRFREKMFVERDENGRKIVDFDFNQVIPMPDYMSGIVSNSTDEAIAALLHGLDEAEKSDSAIKKYAAAANAYGTVSRFSRSVKFPAFEEFVMLSPEKQSDLVFSAFPDSRANVESMLRARKETGHYSWYEWSVEHWGTKWPAYDTIIEDRHADGYPFEFTFMTAWSFPEPVFVAIVEEFPSLHFQCAAFDEGWGFAAHGYYNPPPGEAVFDYCEPDDDLYEIVYGQPPERDEDFEEELVLGDDETAADEGDEEVAAEERRAEDDGNPPVWSV